MTLNITDAELHEWAKMRADDAGRLARELVACRRQSQAAVAAAYEAAANKVDNFASHLSAEAFMFLLRDNFEAGRLAAEVAKLFRIEAKEIRALASADQITTLASPDTITLPRAEVEALLNALTAKTIMDANNSNSTWLDAGCRRVIATLQERMK